MITTDNKFTAEMTDLELVRAVIAGEPGASDFFVDRFSNFVFSILVRNLRMAREQAEDLHQDLFLRLFEDGCRRLRNWSGEGNAANYIGIIVRNQANDYFRRNKVRGEVPLLDQQDEDDDRPPVVPVCTDPSPEEVAESAEQRRLLYKAMEDLTERDQELVHRRHYEEQSYQQIADEMGYKISSVGVLLSRTEERLKKAVDRLIGLS